MAKRFLIASDLHGSIIALDKLINLVNEKRADKLLLLGDIFGTNSSEMVEKLNVMSGRVTIIRGNCDSYFEDKNAKFMIMDNAYENVNGKIAYLCHGHKLNDMYLEGYNAKIIMFGHIHRPVLREQNGIIMLCPGSLAAPRAGSEKCYAFIDENNLVQILTDDGEIVDEMKI